MPDPFAIDYWKVGAALCRALDDLDGYVDTDHVLNVIDKRLDEVYPNLGWRNVMTDNWPLDPSRQRRYDDDDGLEWRREGRAGRGHVWENGYRDDVLVSVRCANCRKSPTSVMNLDFSIKPCRRSSGA